MPSLPVFFASLNKINSPHLGPLGQYLLNQTKHNFPINHVTSLPSDDITYNVGGKELLNQKPQKSTNMFSIYKRHTKKAKIYISIIIYISVNVFLIFWNHYWTLNNEKYSLNGWERKATTFHYINVLLWPLITL